MALRIYISQNENDKVGTVGNWYARVDNMPPIGIDELAALIKEHNIGFSKGSIVGILTDMVSIIRSQMLQGQPVKLDNLAIFKASVENKGGWSDLKDVSLRIGGEKDNIQAIRLVATATGDFTKAELSKDGKLVLDRQSAALVTAAGGNPESQANSGSTESGSNGAEGTEGNHGTTDGGSTVPSDNSDHSEDSDPTGGGATGSFTIAASVGSDGGGTISIKKNGQAVTGSSVQATASDTVVIEAVPENENFQFMSWSDGNSQNPRTVQPSSDLSVTANFLDLSKI